MKYLDKDSIFRKKKMFGKNEQFRKVFWTEFITLAGLVLTHVVDSATAQEILRLLTGMGG